MISFLRNLNAHLIQVKGGKLVTTRRRDEKQQSYEQPLEVRPEQEENNTQLCSRRAADNNAAFKNKDFKILQKRIMSKIFNMAVQDS